MLQSADIAAKSLSGNTLTSRKVHLVGAAGHKQLSMLWPNPQIHLSSLLTLSAWQSTRVIGVGRPSMRRPSPFAAVGMELEVELNGIETAKD